jgi:hypothetical protein
MDGNDYSHKIYENGKKRSLADDANEDEVDVDDDGDENDLDVSENQTTPYLLSNLEVYEMLQPRVQQRQINTNETTTTTTSASSSTNPKKHRRTTNRSNNKLLRHRNWIEEHVVQYIQQSSTIDFHSTQNITPLQSILLRRRRKRKIQYTSTSKQEVEGGDQRNRMIKQNLSLSSTASVHQQLEQNENTNIFKVSDHVCNTANPTITTATNTFQKDECNNDNRMGYHLTEAEMLQIVNISPTEMVDLHLIIDQIHDRYTAQEQEELLQLIDQYRKKEKVIPESG